MKNHLRLVLPCLALLVAGSVPSLAVTATGAAAAAGPQIQGFRSARFGMDEAAVRRCISSDFSPPRGAVRSTISPQDQTENITVHVPGLIDRLGAADVDYVLGYHSRHLVEVVVAWSGAADPKNSAPAILSAATELHAYFLREGFPDAHVKFTQTGQLVVFHGKDAGGHAVLLAMRGKTSKPDAKKVAEFTPTALIVGYANDPLHPDIAEVPKGAF
jgi:hypothetical protein